MKLNLKYYNSQKIKKLLKLKDIVFISCLNFENNKKRLVIEQFFKIIVLKTLLQKVYLLEILLKILSTVIIKIFFMVILVFFIFKEYFTILKEFSDYDKKIHFVIRKI